MEQGSLRQSNFSIFPSDNLKIYKMFKTILILFTPLLFMLCQAGPAIDSNRVMDKANFPIPTMSLSERIEKTRKDIIGDAAQVPSELSWDPQILDNNPILTALCSANVDGNYQNPFNCSQFIMCAEDTVYIWECSEGTQYVPGADLCGYTGGADTCPWKSLWIGDSDCPTIGQSPWWAPLTIPTDPGTFCGSGIAYCEDFEQTGTSACPDGFGYSKSYNGCIWTDACTEIDGYFGF